MRIATVAEGPDLTERAFQRTRDALREYNEHGDVLNRYWGRLADERAGRSAASSPAVAANAAMPQSPARLPSVHNASAAMVSPQQKTATEEASAISQNPQKATSSAPLPRQPERSNCE